MTDFPSSLIETVATSDAKFDGRTYSALGRADRKRYFDRARAALLAIEESGYTIVLTRAVNRAASAFEAIGNVPLPAESAALVVEAAALLSSRPRVT